MSEQEFDLYLKLLSRCLSLTPGQREQIADELRDHLESRLDELAQTGVPRDKAIVQALDEFGDAAVLAANFTAIARLKRRRFIMRLSLGSVGVLTAALLIAYAFWPENRAVRGPEQVVAQDKPAPGAPAGQKSVEPKKSPPQSTPPNVFGGWGSRAEPARPPVVEVCHPITKEVTDYLWFTGAVRASQLLQIQSQASGYLQKVNFRQGQAVKRGDLLFEIDGAIYQAELDKAAAELARSQARLEYARTQFERTQRRFRNNATTPEELDKAASERRVAEADDQVARANLELAKVRLSYTRITAPISGYVGKTGFDVGSLIKAEESVLGSISCLDPVYVSIDVDEPTWFTLRKRVQHGEFRNSEIAVDVSRMPVFDSKRTGYLEFIEDATFDSGRTLMRVRVPNGDAGLVPGLFVQVRYEAGKPHSALLVPQKAFASDSGQSCVWVVGEDNTARLQKVAVTRFAHDGQLTEVTQGLEPSQWVVCDGGLAAGKELTGKRVEPKRMP